MGKEKSQVAIRGINEYESVITHLNGVIIHTLTTRNRVTREVYSVDSEAVSEEDWYHGYMWKHQIPRINRFQC